MKKTRFIFGLAVFIAVLHVAVLGAMIVSRANVLKNGREITLTIRPVDPHDFMRGDYVILSYPALPLGGTNAYNSEVRNIYVRLKRDEKGQWHYQDEQTSAYKGLGEDEIQIKGRRQSYGRFSFGVERFYVPEGKGRDLENSIWSHEKGIQAVLSVMPSGRAMVKRLIYRGESLFETEWY